jgi:electron transfer flavoprotein beta subunit
MKLNIIVCIKSVVIAVPDRKVIRTPESCDLNPFDRPALEASLRLMETYGGTVTALSMGPKASTFSLLEAIAMGVNRSVLVCDPALAGSDTFATSTALASAIKKLAPFDLILFGTRTADSDTGQVGPQTAVLLDLPLVTSVYSIEQMDTGLCVKRRGDALWEKFELSLPAVLTIHPSSAQPRDVGLSGIESAFEEGEVEKWNLLDLGLSPNQVGEAGSYTRVLSLVRVKKERKCEFLSGTTEEQTDELIRRLGESGLIG